MINLAEWSGDIDVRNDPVFEDRIIPFILRQIELLAAFDRQRQAATPDLRYIFHEHAERVADDMRQTCHELGLPENVQNNMYWAMLPHDAGKRLLPVDIWDSKEKPSDEMVKLRRSHVDLGVQIVRDELADVSHPFIDLMCDIMANHHERMDGKGFHGLSGDRLSKPVRLACIVESYDGYTIPRPHFGNRDISPAGVLEKMRSEDGKGAAMFDMELFEAFAKMKLSIK